MSNKAGDSSQLFEHEDLLAISEAMGTLSDASLEAFMRTTTPAGDVEAKDPDCLIVDCEMRDGVPFPIKPAEEENELWTQLQEAALHGASTGTGLLLPKHLALFVEGGADHPARIMVVGDASLTRMLENMPCDGSVSTSELRLLKQLLCGSNLRDAAAADGVSHETKRSQFKSIARKLRSRSQNELINKTLAKIMLTLAFPTRLGATSDEFFADLMREFVPQARTFRLRGKTGTLHRFVDLGPLSGTPAIMFHSQIMPDLRSIDIDVLERIGLRLVIPLRNGAMSQTCTPLGVLEQLDHACEGANLARSHFCGAQAHLLACISGIAYAIEYAQRNPDHVKSFAFVGAGAKPNTTSSTAGRLRSGLFALAMRHWALYTRVIDFYGRRIRQPDTFRRLMLDVYRPSSADMAVLAVEFGAPNHGERARKLFSSSVESIKHDFFHQALPRWDAYPQGHFPALFLHGTADFIHPIDEVRTLALGLGDIAVRTIYGAGQLVYHQHFEPLVVAYTEFIEGVEKSGDPVPTMNPSEPVS